MLARLDLTDFRNHAALRLDCGPGFVVLTGENGAGKTNVLEAVSLLAPGRGLRRAALADMARSDGPGGFGVSAFLKPLPFRGGVGVGATSDGFGEISPTPNPSPEGEGLVSLSTGTLASAPERRIVRIQSAPAAATALAEWVTVLWLTPAMDRLFADAAGERRRFLDRLTLALAPGHAVHANRYEAAMRARTRLLVADAPADPDWLTALESQMAEHGLAIAEARARTVAALADRLAVQPDAPFARAEIALEGWRPGDLAAELVQGRARDAVAGRALAGPHRSDLAVVHAAKQRPAAMASTGEQKALLLGIVLAHAELVAERTGRAPVLLLDEVAAHLDPIRRAALYDRLAGRGQVWMTGTEPALFAGIGNATRITLGRTA